MKRLVASTLAALALGGVGAVVSAQPAHAETPIYTNVGTPNGDIYVSHDGGKTWEKWGPKGYYNR